MSSDREMLFAAMALQQGLVRADALLSLGEDWQAGSTPLADLVIARGLMNAAQRDAIDNQINALISENPGGVESVLAQMGEQGRSVVDTLARSRMLETIDLVSGTSFGQMTTAHDATRSTSAGSLDLTIDTRDAGNGESPRFENVEPIEASGETSVTRYSRTKLHAKGGVGQIWLARDWSLGREVALKELRPEQLGNRIVQQRFMDEARITGQLEHPGIVPIYELASHATDSRPFYTMRFVRGKTFSKAIREYHKRRGEGSAGDLEFRQLLDVFISICNAVAYAHARGVVHRDLKGQNVMLGDFGEVLVLDWGLAKMVNASVMPGPLPEASDGRDNRYKVAPGVEFENNVTMPTSGTEGGSEVQFESYRDATMDGQVLGTPAYMPPEQAEGLVDRVGPWSDIYSLGAILYEILCGQVPYTGSTTAELLRQVRQGTPKPPHQVLSSVPRPLEAVCLKAMRRDPSERYTTAIELAEDLRRWLADEPVSIYRDPWSVRFARWSRRHRTAMIAAASLLVVGLPALGVGNVLIARQRDRAQAMEGVARTAVDDFYVEVADTWLADESDAREEAFLEKAFALYEGPLGELVEEPALPQAPGKPQELDPGRRRAVEGALDYFEKHVDQSGGGRSARLDVARTLLRIGDLRRKLGRFDVAEAAYVEGIRRLEPLGANDLDARLETARLQTQLGSLRSSLGKNEPGESDLSAALERLETLRLDEGRRDRATLARADALIERAELTKVLGRSKEAERDYKAAIQDLEPLLQQAPQGLEVARQLALANNGLGVVLMLQQRSEEAEPFLRRSAALLEPLVRQQPTAARLREALARTQNSLGLVLRRLGKSEDSKNALGAALRTYDRLAGDFPGRVELRRSLARAQVNLALISLDEGDLAESETQFEAAAAAYEDLVKSHPDIPKIQRDLSFAQNNLGAVARQRFEDEKAIAAFQGAAEVARNLVEARPNIPDYQSALGIALLNGGSLQQERGDVETAQASLIEALQIFEQLAKEFPDREVYSNDLSRCCNALGLAYLDLDRKDDAERSFRKAIASNDAVLSKVPDSREARAAQAEILSNLAEMRPEDTDALQSRALDLYTSLARENPDSPDAKKYVAIMQFNRADRLTELGKTQEAEPLFAAAAKAFEAMLPPSGSPGTSNPEPYYLAAEANSRLGALLAETGRTPEAIPHLRSAVEHASAAVKAARGRAFLELLTSTTGECVQALVTSSRYDEAAELALGLGDSAPGNPEMRIEAARLLAACIDPLAEDPGLDPKNREERARRMADRAIAQLRVAVDAGFRDQELGKSTAFAPLSKRSEFQALAEEAATPLGQEAQ